MLPDAYRSGTGQLVTLRANTTQPILTHRPVAETQPLSRDSDYQLIVQLSLTAW